MTAIGLLLFFLSLFLMTRDSQTLGSVGVVVFFVAVFLMLAGLLAFVWRVFP